MKTLKKIIKTGENLENQKKTIYICSVKKTRVLTVPYGT